MATITEQLAECRKERELVQEQRERLLSQLAEMNSSRTQLYLSFGTAVFFMLVLIALAVFINEPTRWQYTLFRTILSLAAGGIAALLPGDFEFRFKNVVRATGAVGVFAFVFIQNPAQLAGIPEPTPTESFQFKVLSTQADETRLSCFTLPYSDVSKLSTKDKILKAVADYMSAYAHIPFVIADYTTYRKIDEKVVTRDSDVTHAGNTGLVLVDTRTLTKMEPHIAFTFANTAQCH